MSVLLISKKSMKMAASVRTVLSLITRATLLAIVLARWETVLACNDACQDFSPNNCLGTITAVVKSGLSTSGLSSQKTFSCGSQQSNLNDRVLQFAVTTKGLYEIETFNIGNFDTTLQVMTCNSDLIGCNDNISSNNKASLVTAPLFPGTQYVALVSKFDSNSQEPTFDFTIIPLCTCNSFAPNLCLGTVDTVGIFVTGLSTKTKGVQGQIQMPCGSKQSGLDDFVFNFQVAVSGAYSISTEDIGDFDTTLSIMDCNNGSVLACNNDRSSTDKSSQVIINLDAGTNYVGAVSKFNSSSQEPTFDLNIRFLSSSPTTTPTTSPTIALAQPVTFAPTLAPTVFNASALGNNNDTAIVIGGVSGGGALLVVLGLAVHRRNIRRRQSSAGTDEPWPAEEEQRLKTVYQSNHDFEAVCRAFPMRSRESIASKVRKLIEDKAVSTSLGNPGAAMLTAPPQEKERYAFVKSTWFVRRGLSPFSSTASFRPFGNVSVASSFSNLSGSVSQAFGRTPAHGAIAAAIPPPPGLTPPMSARNPLYSTASVVSATNRPDERGDYYARSPRTINTISTVSY